MRRYTNWTLVLVGAILTATALASPAWIPIVQPYLVEEAVEETFECRDYLTTEECEVLREMSEEEPAEAFALLEAMNPENDFEVIDPEVQILATRMREEIGSSDTPVPSDIKRGVFNPPIDAVHNASGQAKVIAIVSVDLQSTQYLVRLEGRGDRMFEVNNAPNLRIYLSQHPDPSTPDEVFEGEALEVGRLKGNSGQQNYSLNRDFDSTLYQSLVLYSPDLDQIFGVAPFIEQ